MLNLQKLFEAQAVLNADIEKHHPTKEGDDRLSKKILALLVELGECANEWRGFKFWSNDQEPRTNVKVECWVCQGTGDENYEMVQEDAEGNGHHEYIDCENCNGSGYEGTKNPLLEEYVDCLHFILSIGNDKKFNDENIIKRIEKQSMWVLNEFINYDVVSLFNFLFSKIGDFTMYRTSGNYVSIFSLFDVLGGELGFTWEQIEQAYFAKNKINHARQENGY